jgi:predicted deacylase
LISKKKTDQKGTIICIPIINVYGFVNKSREFPDGRDLNRVFPEAKLDLWQADLPFIF